MGNWTFPFAIPFPGYLDLSTLRAVYERDGKCPVRFLPELLPPARGRDEPIETWRDSPHITPFDTRNPSIHPRTPSTQFAPISPITPAPGNPSLDSYSFHLPSGKGSPRRFNDYSTKTGRSELQQPTSIEITRSTHGERRGRTSMHTEESTATTAQHTLPQSFLEHDVMASVHYELVLTVTHGRFSSKSR